MANTAGSTRNNSPSPQHRLWPHALVAATAFTYIEALSACRSTYWPGLTTDHIRGLVLALALYFATTWVVAFLLSRIKRGVWVVCVAAIILWGLIAAFRQDMSTVKALVLGGALAVFTLGTSLARSVPPWCSIVSILAGTAALHAVSHEVFLSPERPTLSTAGSLAWLALALVAVSLPAYKGRRVLTVMVAALLLALPPAAVWGTTLLRGHGGPPAKPNILLITADALRADYCSVYGGSVPTPNLEALASRGILFDRAYSLAPWTWPSMVAMFASRYPIGLTPGASVEQWVQEMGRYGIRPEDEVLAEGLREEGYVTGAFVANILLSRPDGMLRGFDQRAVIGHRAHVRTGLLESTPYLQDLAFGLGLGVVRERVVDTSRILSAYAIRFLERHQTQPFFLWVHYMDPHAAYDPPDRFRSRQGPWPLYCPADPHWGTPLADKMGHLELSSDEQSYVRSLYEGEIQYVDECLGIVLDKIDALGLGENTYLCFTSDHGEEFWEHGRYGHGHSLYDDLTRVPLLLAGPDVPHQRIEQSVSAVDIMPTLAEWALVQPYDSWQGQSLTPLLTTTSPQAERDVFAQGTNFQCVPGPLQMVVSREKKLIRSHSGTKAELYDLRTDHKEARDLSGVHPETARQLESILADWSAAHARHFGELDEETLSEDGEEKLRSMGYVH